MSAILPCYDEGGGEFYIDPGDQQTMIPPRPALQYSGPVAVLVGPGLRERLRVLHHTIMTVNGRATVVGRYPTAGRRRQRRAVPHAGRHPGPVDHRSRGRRAGREIHIEGKGVVPTVRVPVTAETLAQQADGVDVVLEAAQSVFSAQAPARESRQLDELRN